MPSDRGFNFHTYSMRVFKKDTVQTQVSRASELHGEKVLRTNLLIPFAKYNLGTK